MDAAATGPTKTTSRASWWSNFQEHPGSRHKLVTNVCFQAISRLHHVYTTRHPVPRHCPPTFLRHGYDMATTSTTSTTSTTCLRHLRHLRHVYDMSTTSTTSTTCYDMPRHATTALLKLLLTCIQQRLNTIEEIIR
jgi:hypothetical protein